MPRDAQLQHPRAPLGALVVAVVVARLGGPRGAASARRVGVGRRRKGRRAARPAARAPGAPGGCRSFEGPRPRDADLCPPYARSPGGGPAPAARLARDFRSCPRRGSPPQESGGLFRRARPGPGPPRPDASPRGRSTRRARRRRPAAPSRGTPGTRDAREGPALSRGPWAAPRGLTGEGRRVPREPKGLYSDEGRQ